MPAEINEEVKPVEIVSSDIPNEDEYRRLKKTMGLMVRFYENGTTKKLDQFTSVSNSIEELDHDLKMLREQLESLKPFLTAAPEIRKVSPEGCPIDAKPSSKSSSASKCPVDHEGKKSEKKEGYSVDGVAIKHLNELLPTEVEENAHPKVLQYVKDLNDEETRLIAHRKKLVESADEFKRLYEWSLDIVEACKWLEINLEYYCNEVMKPSPNLALKPRPELTEEKKEKLKNGLKEITYNLQESQDFFEASLDGRLHKFHTIEKECIEAQLKVVKSYPEHSERRKVLEKELEMDLQYVMENMKMTPSAQNRREKMQEIHKDFWDVLRWESDRLQN